jgi:hypothetical protein
MMLAIGCDSKYADNVPNTCSMPAVTFGNLCKKIERKGRGEREKERKKKRKKEKNE